MLAVSFFSGFFFFFPPQQSKRASVSLFQIFLFDIHLGSLGMFIWVTRMKPKHWNVWVAQCLALRKNYTHWLNYLVRMRVGMCVFAYVCLLTPKLKQEFKVLLSLFLFLSPTLG